MTEMSSCSVCGVRWFGSTSAECPSVACPTRAPKPEPDQLQARVAKLEAALRELIGRVDRVGGYATPDDQAILWRAREALR